MTAPPETVPDTAADDDPLPPHDVYAEQVALGAALLSRPALEDLADVLGPADFYRPAHALIAQAALDMLDAGAPVDAVTLSAELTKRGQISRVGGAPYLHTLTSVVPTVANGGYYARIVSDKAALRRFVEGGARITQIGYQGTGDIADLQDRVRQIADAAASPTGVAAETTMAALGDLLPRLYDELERGADDAEAIAPPYKDLRRLVPALRPGQLVTIGARPGVGKTVVALDFARYTAGRLGQPVLFCSLEMTSTELGYRVLAAEAGVNLARFTGQENPLTDAEWNRLVPHQGRLSEMPLVVDDEPHCSLAHIRTRLRAMGRGATGAARLLIIDYLQLMAMPSADTREQQIAAVSRGLKLLAREYEIPVVLLAQLNRAVESRADKMPQLSDFRESGAVEQDSNIALMLHRPEVDDPQTTRAGELDIRVAKNRGGPVGVETVAAQMHYARCADLGRAPR